MVMDCTNVWTSDENDEMMKPQEEKKLIYVDQLLIPFLTPSYYKKSNVTQK